MGIQKKKCCCATGSCTGADCTACADRVLTLSGFDNIFACGIDGVYPFSNSSHDTVCVWTYASVPDGLNFHADCVDGGYIITIEGCSGAYIWRYFKAAGATGCLTPGAATFIECIGPLPGIIDCPPGVNPICTVS